MLRRFLLTAAVSTVALASAGGAVASAQSSSGRAPSYCETNKYGQIINVPSTGSCYRGIWTHDPACDGFIFRLTHGAYCAYKP